MGKCRNAATDSTCKANPYAILESFSNVVVESDGEHLANTLWEIIAGLGNLHLVPDCGNLEDESTTNTGDGSGDEGGDVCGDGLEQLLDVAVSVNASILFKVIAGSLGDGSPVLGEVELGEEISDQTERAQSAINGCVAWARLGGTELETKSETSEALVEIFKLEFKVLLQLLRLKLDLFLLV